MKSEGELTVLAATRLAKRPAAFSGPQAQVANVQMPASMVRILLAFAFCILATMAMPAAALAQDRTLSLYNTHTHERLTVTYKRNGRFVQSGLNQLNRFLRDWRRDEVTRIDPDLFDIVWTVYREVGASEPIHVVSAYRSPATNNMLRRRSSGVARNSQHTQGRAMDFFIPGVSAAEIRAAGLRLESGGVGYYPRSGTPFVHLDTGSVRMWPRMTRAQLQRVFPNGRTIHVPSDGNPLSGYEQALRDYERRSGRPAVGTSTSVASAQTDGDGDIVLPSESGGGFFQALFGGDDADEQPAPTSATQPTAVVTASTTPAAPETDTGPSEPREPYAVASPILPPYATLDGTSAAPSTIAGLSVPSPVAAPTIDDIQLAALSTAVPPSDVQDASPIITASATTAPQLAQAESAPAGSLVAPADARAALAAALSPSVTTPLPDLPPITREEQIAQSVPQPGQIAAIIEARFAERRASEASLAGQVAQALQREPQTAPEPARADVAQAGPVSRQLLTGEQESLLEPGTLSPSEFEVAFVEEPRFRAPAPSPAPAAGVSSPIPALAVLAAPAQAAPAPQQPAPSSESIETLIAAAFASQEEQRLPAQTAIDALAEPTQTAVAAPAAEPDANAAQAAAAPIAGITGRLYPIEVDLSTALAKQSIRSADHAGLVAPTVASGSLSPLSFVSDGFSQNRGFSRSDGFGLSTW